MVHIQKQNRAETNRVVGSRGQRGGHIDNQGCARQLYTAELRGTGDTGGEGRARLVLDSEGGTLTVTIRASGLEPGECHPQAIHAIGSTDRSRPHEQPKDSGGVADLLFEFGPILLLLSPFPEADQQGRVHEKYVISLADQPDAVRALEPARKRMVVLYGKTVEGLYEPAMPVAWGQLHKRGCQDL